MILILFKLLLLAILTVVAANLYRMGGSGKFARQARIVGDAICAVLTVMILAMKTLSLTAFLVTFHWTLIFCFGATAGFISTYWDFINKWLPVQDKDREYWWNWLLHGLMLGLAFTPYVFFVTHNWRGLIYSTLFTGIGCMLVSVRSGKAWFEEKGRGGINNVGKLLLFVK